MDYQAKNKFMSFALQCLLDYIETNSELDSSLTRKFIKNKQDELFLGGDCETLSLILDNDKDRIGDISFGYTIKGDQLKFTFNQASTGSNLWVVEPDLLFEKMRIRAKQEELLMDWFKMILVGWKLQNK